MVPSLVLSSTYGIPQASSVVLSSVPVSEHDILSPRVYPLSMLPSQVGSQPTKFTIPPVTLGPVMSSKD